MGKKDASANRGTPVEQYRKDIGITSAISNLFFVLTCLITLSLTWTFEFVYKHPTTWNVAEGVTRYKYYIDIKCARTVWYEKQVSSIRLRSTCTFVYAVADSIGAMNACRNIHAYMVNKLMTTWFWIMVKYRDISWYSLQLTVMGFSFQS